MERAKPDDADLLSEIQSNDPAILNIKAGAGSPVFKSLVPKVVDWLQVSPGFMWTKNINNVS